MLEKRHDIDWSSASLEVGREEDIGGKEEKDIPPPANPPPLPVCTVPGPAPIPPPVLLLLSLADMLIGLFVWLCGCVFGGVVLSGLIVNLGPALGRSDLVES